MERDIFNIIEEKEFHELTASERAEISEMCTTEEEYLNMKMVLSQVHNLKPEIPSVETKESLDNLFAQQSFPKAAPIWYNSVLTVVVPKDKKWHQQPLVRIAAILLLVIAVVPFLNNQLEQPIQVAQNQPIEEEVSTGVDDSKAYEKKNTEVDLLDESIAEINEVAGNGVNKNLDKTINNQFFDEEISSPQSVALAESVEAADQFEDLGVAATRATAPSFNHPDAGFTSVGSAVKQSISVGANDDVLDLLTVCF